MIYQLKTLCNTVAKFFFVMWIGYKLQHFHGI